MISILAAIVAVLAAVVFVQMGALVELYRQVQQVRVVLDMVDLPEPIDLPSTGRTPGSVGLPAELDHEGPSVVLVMSNKCLSCRTLAEELRGGRLPPHLWVLVVPVIGDAAEFVDEFELTGPRVIVDREQHISEAMGIAVTPVAVFVRDGALIEARTVPTVRQLKQLSAEVGAAGPPVAELSKGQR